MFLPPLLRFLDRDVSPVRDREDKERHDEHRPRSYERDPGAEQDQAGAWHGRLCRQGTALGLSRDRPAGIC